jgi:hypothetical protein
MHEGIYHSTYESNNIVDDSCQFWPKVRPTRLSSKISQDFRPLEILAVFKQETDSADHQPKYDWT